MPRWDSSIAQAMPVGPAPTIATGDSEAAIARFYSARPARRKNVKGRAAHRHDSAPPLGTVSGTRLYRGVRRSGAAWRRLCEFPLRQLPRRYLKMRRSIRLARPIAALVSFWICGRAEGAPVQTAASTETAPVPRLATARVVELKKLVVRVPARASAGTVYNGVAFL